MIVPYQMIDEMVVRSYIGSNAFYLLIAGKS
ncbi:hypothetical protein HNQ54_000081 [Anaerocolumna cellulosilytica]|nr:hypothetical protein [Anaerocolumna cellulosilytica]